LKLNILPKGRKSGEYDECRMMEKITHVLQWVGGGRWVWTCERSVMSGGNALGIRQGISEEFIG